MQIIVDRMKTTWARRDVRIAIAAALALLGAWLRFLPLPNEGYFYDLKVVGSWGRIIALYGWTDVYRHQMGDLSAANYPPGNLAIMGVAVKINDALGGSLQPGGPLIHTLLKIPACLADAWLSLLLYAVVRKFSSARTAITVGLLYWLNPMIWLLSAVWGQTDGVYAAVSFAGLTACMLGFPFLGGVVVALSLFIKIQAIILAPVSLVLIARRPRDILPFLAGVLPVLLLFLPFILADRFADIIWVYTKAPGLPAFASFNMFNFWWGVFAYWAPFVPDTNLLFGFVSYRVIGYTVIIVSYALILRRLYVALASTSSPQRRVEAALAAAVLCDIVFCFFMTRIQQRYTMVFFPCALILISLVPYGRKHLWFLTCSFIFNTLCVMFSYRLGFSPYAEGRLGFLLAWINLFVAADLAAVWWGTVLKPHKETPKRTPKKRR